MILEVAHIPSDVFNTIHVQRLHMCVYPLMSLAGVFGVLCDQPRKKGSSYQGDFLMHAYETWNLDHRHSRLLVL